MIKFDQAITKLSEILAIADGTIDAIRVDDNKKTITISVGFDSKAQELFNSIGIPERLEDIKVDSDNPKFVSFNHVKDFNSEIFGYKVIVNRFEYTFVDKFIERYGHHPNEIAVKLAA